MIKLNKLLVDFNAIFEMFENLYLGSKLATIVELVGDIIH